MPQVTVEPTASTGPASSTPPAHVTVGSDGVARVDPSKRVEESKPTAKVEESRPAYLPEQFKTPEELAKAYNELRAKMDGKPSEKPQATPDAAKAVAEAGLDTSKLSTEIAQTGNLSAESIAALKAKGIDDATITAHVEGVKALASQFRTTLANAVGGEESLKAVSAWAKVNLTNAEAAAFDKAVGSGDPALAQIALQGIHARFVAAEGSDPKLVSGEGTQAAGVEPFKDSAEVTRAMKDPRYKKSQAFRDEVRSRLRVSQVFRGR